MYMSECECVMCESVDVLLFHLYAATTVHAEGEGHGGEEHRAELPSQQAGGAECQAGEREQGTGEAAGAWQ